jgi:hypothetical protein
VDIAPGDRSERWRAEVRNSLAAAVSQVGEIGNREARLAAEATVARIESGIAGEVREAEARSLIGFFEVTREEGEARVYEAQLPVRHTETVHGAFPLVGPLLVLLEEGAPLGIAVLSSERGRLFHWSLGNIETLHEWELELFSGDWRERKAKVSRDPAGEAVSAAGRDQYSQRLESNRERFAHQTGELTRTEVGRRSWRNVLLFGDERYVGPFARGFADRCELSHVDSVDLIAEPTHQIEERVERLLPGLRRDRELALIARVKDAAFAEARSSLGVQETVQALAEGRVEHLLYDPERDYNGEVPSEASAGSPELPLVERMIELALSTGAAITPVSDESAEALREQGGVAALLRY